MNTSKDKNLYEKIKKKADKKFDEKSSIYKSSWIVNEYKKAGGEYSGTKDEKTGLKRWYKEKWVDLNRPIKNKNGKVISYEECGRKDVEKQKYPLCRPLIRVSKDTPVTIKELTPKQIEKAKNVKQKIKETGKVFFKNFK